MSVQIEQNIYKQLSNLIINEKLCKVEGSKIEESIMSSYSGLDRQRSFILSADNRKEMQ